MYGYFLKSSKLSLWPFVIMRILPPSLRAPSSREQVQDRLFLRMHWRFHVVSSPLEELALCFCCFGGTFLLPDVEEGGPSKAIFLHLPYQVAQGYNQPGTNLYSVDISSRQAIETWTSSPPQCTDVQFALSRGSFSKPPLLSPAL